jgi:hypothetical protein
MKKKTIIRTVAVVAITGLLAGGGIGLYMFNMPHRDVQSAKTDYSLTTTQIVLEYLSDKSAANTKYLASDGNSKILEITGVVKKITEDFDGRKIVLLKGKDDKAGVSASFTRETNKNLADIEPGHIITVKGVIRSGADYDEDLGLYENVILEKSDVIKK